MGIKIQADKLSGTIPTLVELNGPGDYYRREPSNSSGTATAIMLFQKAVIGLYPEFVFRSAVA